jgi:hypothetical protein
MSGVLHATVTSVDVGAGVGVDELGTWLVMAAARVVRWAVLFARVGGIPLVSGGAGGRVDGSVVAVAQVVAVASRVSASVAAGLFCVGLVRRVRQGGARSAGTAVAVYAARR